MTTAARFGEKVRDQLRMRHYSLRTEEQYVYWVQRFITHFGDRDPASLGGKDIENFLSHLATRQNVSASTQNQALAAILFLYDAVLSRPLGRIEEVVRARRPRRLPEVLTRDEVGRVMARLEGEPWMVAMLLCARS